VTEPKLAALLVQVIRLRERIAEKKRSNGSYLVIDGLQQQLDTACDKLANVGRAHA